MDQDNSEALKFFAPAEIRARAHRLLDFAEDKRLRHLSVNPGKLKDTVTEVMKATLAAYPDLQIPPYGFWRNLEAGGIDRWGALAGARDFQGPMEMLASAADLALLAAIMRTRSPQGWRYRETRTGATVQGRQATALAAFNMFAAGSFSADPIDPFRVDAETLIRLEAHEIANGLQWDQEADAAFVGGLQAQLKSFGEALALRPDLFAEGETTRPGLLATRMADAAAESVSAETLLDNLLSAFAPVWRGGATANNVDLGDCFGLSQIFDELPDRILPFQLPAQEMVYALVEPFAWAGYEISHLNALTGPGDPEHTALFIGTGVLELEPEVSSPDEAEALDRAIEIRAVTMALIDRLAEMVRKELDVTNDLLPLTCILEGGTSRAGSDILRKKRLPVKNLGSILNPGPVFWLPFGA